MRRSRLHVVTRLAELEAGRRLRDLAAARARHAQLDAAVGVARAGAATSRAARNVAPGAAVDAGLLAVALRAEAALEQQGAELMRERGDAADGFEAARAALAEAKRRVRALERAAERRDDRARLERRRRDDRRLDEASRSARAAHAYTELGQEARGA